MFEIIPGILEKEWEAIERKIEIVRPFATSLHIDLLDGKFAPNISFMDPKPFAKYAHDFVLEVHMMVEEPVQYVDSFAAAGFQRFIGHIEQMSDQAAFVAKGQLLGEVGLALDGPTPVEEMQVPLRDLDTLLLMTIKAGFSGQKFMPEHLEKVKKLTQQRKEAGIESFPIEVDGGINDETIGLACRSGINRFVSTSFLFSAENPEEHYAVLQKKIEESL